jgi:hypothetical protein
LSFRLASAVAALTACWSTPSEGQQPGLATPPQVTAVGPQEVIQTALRRDRMGVAARTAQGGANASRSDSFGSGPANQAPVNPPVGFQPAAAPSAEDLRLQLDLAIEVSSRRFLRANEHSPWQIFHGLLALKQDFLLNLGPNKVNAIEWIATAEPRFDNQLLLQKTPHGGKFHAFTRPYAFEGHPAQFLALLSQSDLPLSYSFKVGNDRITMGDIINNTMKEVNTREEVTWVLWGLQHYLKPDAQWVNQHNEPWSIERLVQIETNAPVIGAPCGGNHRLFALTRTRDKHLKHGGQLVGIWAQTDHKIRQHIEIARSLQNYDGTFSSKFYETSGYTNDLNQRFNTTGHTMEFLSIGLPDERLNEPWVQKAIAALCNDLIVNRQRQIDCGPLYHTLNSLIIYRDRIRATQSETKPSPGTTPATRPEIAGAATPDSKSDSKPALSTSPMPVVRKSSESPKPAEPARTSATAILGVPGAPVASTTQTPKVPVEQKPSVDALNELKLEGESRDRLNALTSARTLPLIVPPDTTARPLESTGQPVLQEINEPVSALLPEND